MTIEKESGEINNPIEKLKDIISTENIDMEMTFSLNNEKDALGKKIEGDAFWVKFKHEGKVAEGKVFVPEDGQHGKLVIFDPGMPGSGVVWMEEKFVAPLLKNGYTVTVLRHLGAKTQGERFKKNIHSPERSEKSNNTIGNGQYDIEGISHEVEVATNAMGEQFKDISLIGHSGGVLNIISSIKDIDQKIQAEINRIISLSGFVDEDSLNIDLEKFYEYCKKYLNMGEAHKNVQTVEKMFKEIYNRGNKVLPDNTMLIQVNSPKDEFFDLKGAEKFKELLTRGLNITDETQTESEFHDLKNLQPKTLLRLLEMHYPKSKHDVSVFQQTKKVKKI